MAAVQAANHGLPIAVIAIVSLVFDSEEVGWIALAMSIMQLLSIVVDYGFNIEGSRQVALLADDRKSLVPLVAAIIVARMIVFLAVAVLLLLFCTFIANDTERYIYLTSLFGVFGMALMPFWLFQGLGRCLDVAVIYVFFRAATLGLLMLIPLEELGSFFVVLLVGLSNVFAALFVLARVVKMGLLRGFLRQLSGVSAIVQIRKNWVLFSGILAANSYTAANVIMVGVLLSPVAAGVYFAAERLARATLLLFSPINQAIFPVAVRLRQVSVERMLRLNRMSLGVMTVVGFVVSFFMCTFSHELSVLIYPGQSSEVSTVLKVLAWMPFLVAVSGVLGLQVMIGMGMESAFSRIMYVAGFVNVFLFSFLASVEGVIGAAYANILIEILIVILMSIALYRAGLNPIWCRLR